MKDYERLTNEELEEDKLEYEEDCDDIYQEEESEYYDNVLRPQIERLNRM